MKMIVWNLALFFIVQIIAADPQEPLETAASLSFRPPTEHVASQIPSIMYGIGEGGSHPIFSASEMQYKPIPTYPRHTQKLPSPNENIPYSPNPSQMHFIQPDRAIALTQQAKEQALDLLIKNRLAALQRLQINLNKLLDDIINIASTFVSKHSFFGGVTRRSLFDLSAIDDVKVVSADLVNIGSDLNRISRNTLEDLDTFIQYMSDHRNFDFRNLLTNAVSTALRIFSY